jgi:hypothetical protein
MLEVDMGAATKVYVKVTKEIEEWMEVYAVTRTEAMDEVRNDINVVRVLDAQYEKPEDL